MASRLSLQTMLENLLGSPNVYYNPPASVLIEYDAIVYSRKNIGNKFANNSVYKQENAYKLTVIYEDPDSELPKKISQLPKCRHETCFKSDNLNHDVFTLYF